MGWGMRTRTLLLSLLLVAGCGASSVESQESPAAADEGASPTQAAAFARLQAETKQTWSMRAHAVHRTPATLSGRTEVLLQDRTRAFETTVGFLERHKDLFGMKNARAELKLTRDRADQLGMHHVRMQQMVKGVPVWLGEVLAHYDQAGRMVEISAIFVPELHDLDVTPTLSLDDAVASAKADFVAAKPELAGDELAVEKAELMVYAPGDAPARLGWHFRLRGLGEHPALQDTMVDAKNGAILNKFDNLQHVTATATGASGKSRTIEVTQAGTYQMIDATRQIRTYDAANGQPQGLGTLVTSSTPTSWDQQATRGKGVAVDAHFNAGVVYDFYKKVLGRSALDGKGTAMLSTVHYGQGMDNAFWDGTRMAYGDGAQVFKPLAISLDVVAHEFTHGVTENESGLVYQTQSGALNESVSDVFGAIIEHYLSPDDAKNMVMGEDIGIQGPLRDMKNPAAGGQPAHMSKFVRTTQDNGGVHTNSGIPNNAFYLMTLSGTNPTSQVKVPFGLGWDKSTKLWYRTNTELLTSGSDFAAIAAATMRAAKDLSLTQNEQNIVECAWIATGVTPGTCKSITNPQSQDPTPSTPEPGSSSGSSSGSSGRVPSSDEGNNSNGDGTDSTEEEGTTRPSQRPNFAQTNSGCSAAPGAGGAGLLLPMAAAVLGLVVSRRRRTR